jgi:hypothetical protein
VRLVHRQAGQAGIRHLGRRIDDALVERAVAAQLRQLAREGMRGGGKQLVRA